MSINFEVIPEDFDLEKFRQSACQSHQLKFGWNIAQTPQHFYKAALNSSTIFLTFTAAVRPEYDPTLKPYDFKAGLWQQDVFEIFLGEDGGTAYQEFNFAPSGAYWSGCFTEYRLPARNDLNGVRGLKIAAEQSEKSWSVSVAIPRDALAVRHSFAPESLCNVTAILGLPERQYLSASQINSEKPDFHRFF